MGANVRGAIARIGAKLRTLRPQEDTHAQASTVRGRARRRGCRRHSRHRAAIAASGQPIRQFARRAGGHLTVAVRATEIAGAAMTRIVVRGGGAGKAAATAAMTITARAGMDRVSADAKA